MHGVAWVQEHVHSPQMFLRILNLVLLVVGAAMDIYSGILVVVPLILPMAKAFGIHPVHLGIVFLATMELGFLMPPEGLNLFVSSYRFDRPVLQVVRAALPFQLILAASVVLVTFWPKLSLLFLSH